MYAKSERKGMFLCIYYTFNPSATYVYQSIHHFLSILFNFSHLNFVISILINIHPGFQIMPWPFIDVLNLPAS
jgi:hypothetical protein